MSSVERRHGWWRLQATGNLCCFDIFSMAELIAELGKDNTEATMEILDGFKSAGGGEDS